MERPEFDACHTVWNCHICKVGTAIESESPDDRYAWVDNNSLYFWTVVAPRGRFTILPVGHSACTGNGENAVFGESPRHAVLAANIIRMTACAGSDNCSRQKGGFVLRGRFLHRYLRRFRGRLGGRLRRGFRGGFRRRRFRRVGLRIAAGHGLRLLRSAVRRPCRNEELNGEDDRKKHGKPFFHILYAPFLCENAIYNHNVILYPSPGKKQGIWQTLYRIFRRVYRFFIFSAAYQVSRNNNPSVPALCADPPPAKRAAHAKRYRRLSETIAAGVFVLDY